VTADNTPILSEPFGLGVGGCTLWRGISQAHPGLDAAQIVQLTEACRAKDRLDELDAVLRGDAQTWMRLVMNLNLNPEGSTYELRINAALSQANATANTMKQLLAALRLPDVRGNRPQYHGPRGVQVPTVPGGRLSSLDRARAAKTG
jgi:hypothetical protein